jgi:hypothetical protein
MPFISMSSSLDELPTSTCGKLGTLSFARLSFYYVSLSFGSGQMKRHP